MYFFLPERLPERHKGTNLRRLVQKCTKNAFARTPSTCPVRGVSRAQNARAVETRRRIKEISTLMLQVRTPGLYFSTLHSSGQSRGLLTLQTLRSQATEMETVFSTIQGAAKGVRQKECDHIFRFRDAFGHFSVTFSDASVTFRHFCAELLLPDSFCGRVRQWLFGVCSSTSGAGFGCTSRGHASTASTHLLELSEGCLEGFSKASCRRL